MTKVMETTSVKDLFGRISGEYASKGSIYDIPKEVMADAFALESASPGFDILGTRVFLPVGPAAGPHTQIAPNIVAAYLAGSRVFELKTVQKNDRLDIEKPCIDALDDGHNTEWSTELSLDEAREEYLCAWIALNVLEAVFSKAPPLSFVFNMSVGYDLEGIKGERMDAFIEGMRNPAKNASWKAMLGDAALCAASDTFLKAFGKEGQDRALALFASFPASPVHSVTLSTMHGCPPAEIERIGLYLVNEKKFNTAIKLNPTLLGFEAVRAILDGLGWNKIILDRHGFENDLAYPDALKIIASLRDAAVKSGVKFSLKMSNTLANKNNPGNPLPGGERYMSGRALFPVTSRLAAKLSGDLEYKLQYSFCGGVSSLNAKELVQAGIGPLTVATDLLKPGGYLRMTEIAREAVKGLKEKPAGSPDPAALEKIAVHASKANEYRGDFKEGRASIPRKLPAFDCFAAPCIEACPVNQKVPSYIADGAAGKSAKALETILADNPLPNVTGTLCDHVCMAACSRVDYEGAVKIRGAKLSCAHAADIPGKKAGRNIVFKGKAAVIGAGPAGLACAHFLALEGIPVTIFDKDLEPGGVVANVVPGFRIPAASLKKDIDRIKALGVEFELGHEVSDIAPLKARGFTAFFAGTGAPVARKMRLTGEGVKIEDALEFLIACRANPGKFKGSKKIAVAGGGNTAMDSVRAALRLPGIESVSILYRRTRAEMPAEREEIDTAIAEGGKLRELALPEALSPGSLAVRIMELGEPDASGRRAPVASAKTEPFPCDLLIQAIGEEPDRAWFEKLGVAMGKDGKPVTNPETLESSVQDLYIGGDAVRGPASIIKAESDGRRAAFAIMKKGGITPESKAYSPVAASSGKLASRGKMIFSLPESDPGFMAREAERCLCCDSACLRCVEVCPNRANTFIKTGNGFAQGMQIIHVDALCNECGNCAAFCPWEGKPYTDKPTLFATQALMKASKNRGFMFIGAPAKPDLAVRSEQGEKTLVNAEWTSAAPDLDDETKKLVLLAKETFANHKYLYGGAP